LLINQQRINAAGTPELISTAMWAGNAASSITHHQRAGASNNAAVRIAFGGHNVEIGCGENVTANPTLAPM